MSQQTGEFVKRFEDVVPDDRPAVGGKGLQLGSLAQGGFAVPPGFCVTTEAYREFIRVAGAVDSINQLAEGIDFSQAEKVEEVTSEIRELILGGEIPDEIQQRLRDAYSVLGEDTMVAVRSSATAEDMPGASFAGMHDTLLDIRGFDNLCQALKQCWASGWTARAASYRAAHGFDQSTLYVGVVVQAMVSSETSGVMFTGNPVTSNENEVVINASWGLGEAIVSGITQPDEFTLDKASGAVKERTLGGKTVRVVRNTEAGSGTVTEDVPTPERERFCVSEEQLSRLAEVGRKVEAHYDGIHQDIEWGIEGDEIFVLQSRDITAAAFPFQEGVERWQADLGSNPDTIWSRKMADEYATGPYTPFFYSIRAYDTWVGGNLFAADSDAFGYRPKEVSKQHFQWIKGRLYVNSDQHREDILFFGSPDARGPWLEQVPPNMRDGAPSIINWATDLFQGYQNITRNYPEYDFGRWIQNCYRFFEESDAEIEVLRVKDLTELSDEELKKHLDRTVELFTTHIAVITPGFLLYIPTLVAGLGRLLAEWYDGDPQITLGGLLTGFEPATPTTLENIRAWELAQKFKDVDGALEALQETDGAELPAALAALSGAEELLAEYEQFLADHSHRGHADRDIRFPRWGDKPENLSVVLRTMASSATSPREVDENAVATQRQLADDIRAKLMPQSLGMARVMLFDFILRHCRDALHMRDYERFEADKTTWEKSRAGKELGRRLHERGFIEDPEDFLFLSREEVYELLEKPVPQRLIDAKVASRKRIVENYREAPLWWQDGAPLSFEDAEALEGNAHRGAGVSPGEFTGTARVILTLDEIGRIEDGDILVTNSTDPGWASAFLSVRALVLETGGSLAHGAVLSREYGLPAVTSLEGATALIPDGAQITVDGTNGIVTIHDGDEEGGSSEQTEPAAAEV